MKKRPVVTGAYRAGARRIVLRKSDYPAILKQARDQLAAEIAAAKAEASRVPLYRGGW